MQLALSVEIHIYCYRKSRTIRYDNIVQELVGKFRETILKTTLKTENRTLQGHL